MRFLSKSAVLPFFVLVECAGLLLQLLKLVVLRFFLGFELLSQSLEHVILFNELDPLHTGVDVWFWDAQFSEKSDSRLGLTELFFVMRVVLKVNKNHSNHRLYFVVLLEQLCGLERGAA